MSANLMSLARSGGKFLKLFGDRKMMKTIPTARDYVQDGLIAMWDGIEGGWANIVGGHEQMEFVGTHQLKNDYVYIDGRSGSYGIVNGLSLGSNPTTQEFVVKIDDRDGYGRIIAENTGLCLSGIGESMFRLYGFGLDANISYNVIFGERMSVSLGIGNEKVDHLYLNGESIKLPNTINVVKSNYPSVATFFNREAGRRGITGELCCARIYNRVISDQDIAANYAIDKARFNLPD